MHILESITMPVKNNGKVSFFAAFFATSPFILIQVWKFIAPGLYKHEKKAIMPYLILTPILFLLGGMLVYYLIMPLAIKFFLTFESVGLNTNLPIQRPANFIHIRIGAQFNFLAKYARNVQP